MARIVKGKIADAVLAEIRRMILSGELKEGDKLPNQMEFAAQLGVSRPSLREALQTLSRLGAIEQRPGLGTVLKSRAAALMSKSLEMSILSDEQGTIQLTEVRRIIETGMVELAVERATEGEMAQIASVMQAMEKTAAENDIPGYREQDLLFHNIIADACHNQFVQNLFQEIRSSFEQFLKESFEAMPFMLENSLQGHRDIFTGLMKRDSEMATAAMRKHLLLIQRAVEDYFRNNGIKQNAR
jgi:GntR family transcriptional repressor for pyruvate dehydrogenase complex